MQPECTRERLEDEPWKRLGRLGIAHNLSSNPLTSFRIAGAFLSFSCLLIVFFSTGSEWTGSLKSWL